MLPSTFGASEERTSFAWRRARYSQRFGPRDSYNDDVELVAIDSPAASADYRRRARRIRANLASNPASRQRALRKLATQRNLELQPAIVDSQTALQGRITSVIERGFTEHAASKLQPFGFTFSDRVALLDAAERLGIARFRANMILATQEHAAPARRFAAPEVPARSIAPSFLVILSIEAAVVVAMVLLFSL